MEQSKTNPIHILSLGAGVQSSTLALMAARGEVGPMPVAAIFADTQAEPQSVYRWLEWLEKELPFPVYRVTKGSLTEAQLTLRKRTRTSGKPYSNSLIPAFVKNADGTQGIMGRGCTYDFKILQLIKKERELGGIKRGQKTIGVVSWIGISLDEVVRMKSSRVAWCKNRWPLIEKEMTRHDCMRWMSDKGYPTPPRSACVYCPFHSDNEWRRLQKEEPEEFERAVAFERNLQEIKRVSENMNGVPFLHRSLKPLDQVDFTTDQQKGQGILHGFGAECEGLCGV